MLRHSCAGARWQLLSVSGGTCEETAVQLPSVSGGRCEETAVQLSADDTCAP